MRSTARSFCHARTSLRCVGVGGDRRFLTIEEAGAKNDEQDTPHLVIDDALRDLAALDSPQQFLHLHVAFVRYLHVAAGVGRGHAIVDAAPIRNDKSAEASPVLEQIAQHGLVVSRRDAVGAVVG